MQKEGNSKSWIKTHQPWYKQVTLRHTKLFFIVRHKKNRMRKNYS